MLKRLLTLATDKVYTLPIIVLMPHSRCNCRCVMCDIWKSNHDKKEITSEELAKHITAFRKLGVKRVTLSGGEALMHANLWKLCDQLKGIGIKISLLSTGLTLRTHASEIVRYIDDVIVSLDGSVEIHNAIRNIPAAFQKLQEGVHALKQMNRGYPVAGRCVLQKLNFRDLLNIIAVAQTLGLDQISFLAADVSSTAFNRTDGWGPERINGVGLNQKEVREFRKIVEGSIRDFADLYAKGFIAESPRKMLELVQYYEALLGLGEFPGRQCNAPWVSAVIEADGEVRPCFFHDSYGSVYEKEFLNIINSPNAISFRRKLNVKKDPVCKKCVCSLKIGLSE